MKVISLKDYAAEKNISYEAVRQQVVRYKNELGSHVIKDGRQQFLDEEAVAFLDSKRQKNPVAIIQQSKDEAIASLREEREQLLRKIAAQADEISKLAQWKADKAMAIAEADQTKLLLDNTRAELDQVREEKAAQEKDFAWKMAEAKSQAWDEAQQELGETAAQAIESARKETAEAKERAERLDLTLGKVQKERDTAQQDNKRLEDVNFLLSQENEQLRKHPLRGFIKSLFVGNKDSKEH